MVSWVFKTHVITKVKEDHDYKRVCSYGAPI